MTEKVLVLTVVLGVAALALLIGLLGEAATSDFLVGGIRCLTCHAAGGL